MESFPKKADAAPPAPANGKDDDSALGRLGGLLAQDNTVVGLVIDTRYEVRQRIARGGMGEVFLAHDRRLNRPIAMKILAAEVSGKDWAERFQAEARTLTVLEHPGVVPIHDLGTLPDGRLYYTMKYIQGLTLAEKIAAGEARDKLLPILVSVCEIVQHAHDRKIIHRDLKPANVMLNVNDHVFVVDWGIARVRDEIRRAHGTTHDGRAGMTHAGAILGTIEYMPPEQALGDLPRITARSDVYGLGAILYEILTGRPPVATSNQKRMIDSVLTGSILPPRLIDPSIPVDLEAVCLKALQHDPVQRYDSARELSQDLQRYQQGRSVRARPLPLWERMLRFVRRRPLLVSFSAAAFLGLAVLAVVLVDYRNRVAETDQARRSADERLKARESALKNLERVRPAIEKAHRQMYEKNTDFEDLRKRVGETIAVIREVLETAPDLTLAHYALGRAHDLIGDWETADACWEKTLETDPQFGPARYQRGRLLLMFAFHSSLMMARNGDISRPDREEAERRTHEAARELERAVADGSGFDDLLHRDVASAMLAYLRQDWETVRRIAERGLEQFPASEGREDFHWLLGLSMPRGGKENQYDRALEIRPLHYPSLISRGWDRSRRGDLKGAIEDYTQVLRIRPKDPHARINRGIAYLKRKEFDKSLEDFDAAVRDHPDEAKAFTNRAGVRYQMGDFDGAIEDATEAIRIDPMYSLPYNNRGCALQEKGETKAALKDFEKAIEIDPANDQAYLNRGELRSRLGDVDAGIRDLTEAIRLNPALQLAYYNRARMYQQKRDYDRAFDDYSEALRLDPGDAQSRHNRARIFMIRKEPRRALEEFDEILRTHPHLDKPYFSRADVRQMMGENDAAIDDCDKALEINPNYAEAWHLRGAIKRKTGDLAGAAADLRKALDVAPDGWPHRSSVESLLEDVRKSLDYK